MSTALLSLTGISVAYGQISALSDVTLEVRAGETVALLGANGAGKSTLMKTVMGFLTPRSGVIQLDGRPFTGLAVEKRVRRGLGYCPEGRRVFPGLSVRENLLVAARADAATCRRRLDAVLAHFPALEERLATLAWQLSGGQQQMLAIGRALMTGPRLLLLDEPSLGLSPRLATELLDKLRDIASGGTAILLAEQSVAKALELCDRAYVLELGRIRAVGTATELARNDVVRKAFLGG